jgi:hypothetical protein
MTHCKLGSQCLCYRLYWTVGLADFKREGTRAPCLPQGHSASSLLTGNITLTWYLRNLFRVCNSQHIAAGSFTDLPFSAPVSRWHDVRWKSFQTLVLPHDVNIIAARSKITAVAAIVIELWHKPRSGDWRITVSAPRQICVTQAVRYLHIYPFAWNDATMQWQNVGEARYMPN